MSIKTNMVSAPKKRPQGKRLRIQLDKTADDFINGNTNTNFRNTNVADEGQDYLNTNIAKHSTTEIASKVDMQTLEKISLTR